MGALGGEHQRQDVLDVGNGPAAECARRWRGAGLARVCKRARQRV
jgi:hypothetical protein